MNASLKQYVQNAFQREEARTVAFVSPRRDLLDSLVHYDSAIAGLSVILGTDASKFDPEGPLPPIPDTNASKSGRDRLVEYAAKNNVTVRQLAQRVGGYQICRRPRRVVRGKRARRARRVGMRRVQRHAQHALQRLHPDEAGAHQHRLVVDEGHEIIADDMHLSNSKNPRNSVTLLF